MMVRVGRTCPFSLALSNNNQPKNNNHEFTIANQTRLRRLAETDPRRERHHQHRQRRFYNESDAIRSMERDHETAYFVHTYATHPSAAVLKVKLTTRSFEIFKDAAEDAGNWSGSPCLGGNFRFTKEDRGNLTQLKRAKLLTTDKSDGEALDTLHALGHEFAAFHGIEIHTQPH